MEGVQGGMESIHVNVCKVGKWNILNKQLEMGWNTEGWSRGMGGVEFLNVWGMGGEMDAFNKWRDGVARGKWNRSLFLIYYSIL
jgi:hypothetical protein